MDNVKFRKTVGTALCVYFGMYVLARICTANSDPMNQSYQAAIWIIADLICCVAMCYIAFNKSLRIATIGKAGALALGVLNLVLCLNWFLDVFAKISAFSFLGFYFSPVISILEVLAVVPLLFYGLKSGSLITLLINVSGTLFFVFKACAAFLVPLMAKTTDIAEFQSLMDTYSTLQDVALIAAVLTVIVTIVWMLQNPKSQQVVESKKEEII